MPSNVDYTCKQGARKLIDFGICSGVLSALVRNLEADTGVPFGPHFGLRLSLHANPSELVVRTLVKPCPLYKVVARLQSDALRQLVTPDELDFRVGWSATKHKYSRA